MQVFIIYVPTIYKIITKRKIRFRFDNSFLILNYVNSPVDLCTL